jgi:predicted enzyme related to lactoylglutathione lyase
MPTRDETPHGSPCWIDLSTSDPDASRAFYTELFGWTTTEPNADFGGYANFASDGALVGGSMPNDPSQGAPDGWSLYLATDDIEKSVETATSNGAQVIVPAMQLADLGSMAVVSDPTGAMIGMWQAGTHKGMGVLAEPNAPGWFELFTRDHPGAVAFYRDVFGWDIHMVGDSEEFRYATKGQDEAAEAGIMDAGSFPPDGVPAHWSVYFKVADADAAIAKAVSLGGSVVVPAEDTPYGRLATLTDVTGAQFKLLQ